MRLVLSLGRASRDTAFALAFFATAFAPGCGGGSSSSPAAAVTGPTPGPPVGAATGVDRTTSYALARNTIRVDWSQFAQRNEFVSARVLADFDRDGVPDLFVAPGVTGDGGVPIERAVGVRVYKGRASGGRTLFDERSASFVADPVPALVWARKALAADFNGDGRPDVFVAAHGYDAPPYPGTVNALLLSGADGLLRHSSQSWSGYVGFHHGAAAGDVDNDGDVDIFVADSNNQSYFLLNDGKGTFTQDRSGVPASLRRRTPVFAVEVFDLDQDGYLDLVVGGAEPAQPTMVFWGNGSGSFEDGRSAQVPAPPVWNNPLVFAAEDVDGDGRRELVVGRTKGTAGDPDFYKGYYFQVLKVSSDRRLGDVTATWASALNDSTSAMLRRPWDGQPTWTEWFDVIDADGDGRLDILTSDAWAGNFRAPNLGSSFGPLQQVR